MIRRKLWPAACAAAAVVLVPTAVWAASAAFTSSSGTTPAVKGTNNGTGGEGVMGLASKTSSENNGVWGQSASTAGRGVTGSNSATTGLTKGVYGRAVSRNGTGVWGTAPSGTADTSGDVIPTGVYGEAPNGALGVGVWGYGNAVGVFGQANDGGLGVWSVQDAGLSSHLLATPDVAGVCQFPAGEPETTCLFGTPFPDGTFPAVVLTPTGPPGGHYWVDSASESGFQITRDGTEPEVGFYYVVVGMAPDLSVAGAATAADAEVDTLRHLAGADR